MPERLPSSFASEPEKKQSSVGKWVKRTAALAGAAAVGYVGGLKKERGAEEIVPSPKKPKTIESAQPVQEGNIDTGTNDEVKTHVEMKHVKIADGIEQEHAFEVDDAGKVVRDLGAYHLWQGAQKSSGGETAFRGYGTETHLEEGEITKTPYGSKTGNKTSFQGYGVATETKDGKVTKTPYGETKGDKKKFRGYGVEQ